MATGGCNGHRMRVSTQSELWRREFFRHFCWDSNSITSPVLLLTNKLSRLPLEKCIYMLACACKRHFGEKQTATATATGQHCYTILATSNVRLLRMQTWDDLVTFMIMYYRKPKNYPLTLRPELHEPCVIDRVLNPVTGYSHLPNILLWLSTAK